MAIAAVQNAGEEWLASWLAKDRSKYGHYYSSRIPKKAAYGSFLQIHVTNGLFKLARYLFHGRTSPDSKLSGIFFGLFVVCSMF